MKAIRNAAFSRKITSSFAKIAFMIKLFSFYWAFTHNDGGSFPWPPLFGWLLGPETGKGLPGGEKLEKDKVISEDDKFRGIDELQKVVDKYIAKIDELLKGKEKEILEF